MKDDKRTKQQLLAELGKLRQTMAETEQARMAECERFEHALKQSEERFQAVIENVGVAIHVAQEGQLKFVNCGTIELSGYSQNELMTLPFTDFIHPDDRNLVHDYHVKRTKNMEVPRVYPFRIVSKVGQVKWVELHTVLITWQNKPATCNFLIDITKRKLAEEAREKLILELQEAISKVKTLSGMLPICSSCKKIRNDKGYWTQIESYVQDHSAAEFSHGICPECIIKLYPDFADDVTNKTSSNSD